MPESFYARLKRLGVCACCTKRDAEPGKSQCAECNARDRARREEKRAEGICTKCMSRPTRRYQQCWRCRKFMRGHARRTKQKRREQALCTTCGGEREFHREGLLQCQTCQDRATIRARSYAGRLRKERMSKGQCVKCTRPLDAASKSRCSVCLEIHKMRGRRDRARKREAARG